MAYFGMKHPELVCPLLLTLPGAAASFFKHVFPAAASEKFYEASRNGKPMGFTESLEEMILDELALFDECPEKDVLSDRFTTEKHPLSSKYRMFVSDDLLGVALGTPRFLFADACYVGIPYNVFYHTVDDVARDYDRLKISASSSPSWWWQRFFGGSRARLQNVEWGSEMGVKLMESLVLTKDEKQFLIQRCIQEADAVNTPAYDALPFAVPMCLAGIVNAFARKWMEMKHRYAVRPSLLPFYFTTTVAGLFAVIFAKRACRNLIDARSDKLTAQIGETYSRGGVGYYNKLMERNRCINGLLEQANMERTYAPDGDYLQRRFTFRQVTGLKERLKVITEVAKEQTRSKGE